MRAAGIAAAVIIMAQPGRPLSAPAAIVIAVAQAVAGILASRKPSLLFRFPVVSLSRLAERALRGLLFHDAPRSTRRAQSPAVRCQTLPRRTGRLQFHGGLAT